jgi:hypothetical protein
LRNAGVGIAIGAECRQIHVSAEHPTFDHPRVLVRPPVLSLL